MFCLSVKGFLNVVGPVRCMRETSGTLSRNHSVSSRGIERLGTVRPERVLPETRRLPLMVEEEVRAFEFGLATENFRWASNAPEKKVVPKILIYSYDFDELLDFDNMLVEIIPNPTKNEEIRDKIVPLRLLNS